LGERAAAEESGGIRPIITSAPINRLPSSPQMNIIETGLNAIRLPSVTNVLDEYSQLTSPRGRMYIASVGKRRDSAPRAGIRRVAESRGIRKLLYF
jgi:hypothetical protein